MLRVGQRFTLNGLVFKVETVSYGRAHCVAKQPKTVHLRERTFTAHRYVEIDIAPTTDLSVLAEMEGAAHGRV